MSAAGGSNDGYTTERPTAKRWKPVENASNVCIGKQMGGVAWSGDGQRGGQERRPGELARKAERVDGGLEMEIWVGPMNAATHLWNFKGKSAKNTKA